WLVHTPTRSIKQFELTEKEVFALKGEFLDEGTLQSEVLKGFSLDVKAFFEELEENEEQI
ncbi:MAG: hypothetical protein AAF740_12785, partial [Bacteroidota bacterium]